MSTDVQFDITQALKAALKARGITYKMLATRLEVSEQTIKRLFKERDSPLSRLVEICQVIGVSFYDLVDVASRQNEEFSAPTSSQEQFLAAHPAHFAFLMHLLYKVGLAEIQQTFGLSDRRLFEYLRDLDRQGFIELGANNQFRLLVQGHVLWNVAGPLQARLRQLCCDFVGDVMLQPPQPRRYFTGSVRYMSQATIERFLRDLDELIKGYRSQAFRDDALLPRERLIPMKWAIAVAPFDLAERLPIA